MRAARSSPRCSRIVQAIDEQTRVTRCGLESRLGVKLKGSHAVTSWLVERSVDVLNKHRVGSDSRTPYERSKGKAAKQLAAEFGEKMHYRINLQGEQGARNSRRVGGRGACWGNSGGWGKP